MAAMSSLARLSAAKPAVYFRRGGTEHSVVTLCTPNGKSTRLLATALTMESLPALRKVVVPSVRRIDLRCRPVESVGFQSCILAIFGTATTEQGIESRAASGHERLVCSFT